MKQLWTEPRICKKTSRYLQVLQITKRFILPNIYQKHY
jgi:hypothetical protein